MAKSATADLDSAGHRRAIARRATHTPDRGYGFRTHSLRSRSGMTSVLALVGRFARGDLFDQLDNAAPELGVGDARERTGQREALGGCEKIGNVSRRGSFAVALGTRGAAGSSLEQKRYRNLEYFGDLLNPAGADPVGALFVFL